MGLYNMNYKLMISYFYQIRFFESYMIPVSTAVWDPKWYHENQGSDHIWIDKRGVINGMRTPLFNPSPECNGLCSGHENCATKDPTSCEFLRIYRHKLDKINIESMHKTFSTMLDVLNTGGFDFSDTPVIVLIVHESPDNPCSERRVILEWCKDNCIEISEFAK